MTTKVPQNIPANAQTTVDLKTSKNILLNRLQDDDTRPLLNVENKEEVLDKIMHQREQKYQTLCNYEMLTDNTSIQENCNKIMEMINV